MRRLWKDLSKGNKERMLGAQGQYKHSFTKLLNFNFLEIRNDCSQIGVKARTVDHD